MSARFSLDTIINNSAMQTQETHLLDDIAVELEADKKLKKSKIRVSIATILAIIQIINVLLCYKYWHPTELYMLVLKASTMTVLPVISFVWQNHYRSSK